MAEDRGDNDLTEGDLMISEPYQHHTIMHDKLPR